MTLPPATITSVPIYDFVKANEEVANETMETYYPCCGKSVCEGCIYSFCESGNHDKCPFCNSKQGVKTDEGGVEEIMKRVAANDPASIYVLAGSYRHGINGVQQDLARVIELYVRAANLGYSKAHNNMAGVYSEGGGYEEGQVPL